MNITTDRFQITINTKHPNQGHLIWTNNETKQPTLTQIYNYLNKENITQVRLSSCHDD
jgi:hypothetical protein